jgi:Uma2 family endonuclease
MTTSLNFIPEDILYPDDDGNPMAESTEQYRWIVMIKENLELLLSDQTHVFIAADLIWYPVQVTVAPAPRQAPDVMVIFGRPKGKRRSYLQWKEENIPAQVVFEILSDSNKTRDGVESMMYKFGFYERYGVEEYYIYDPDEHTLEGWQRQGTQLQPIDQMSGWVSPRLGIRFDWQPQTELMLYQPDGKPFLSFLELHQRAEQAELELQRTELELQQAELELQRTELELQQAELQTQQAQQQAEQERSRANQAEQNLQMAASRLLALGLGVEEVATTVGLPIATVQSIVDVLS